MTPMLWKLFRNAFEVMRIFKQNLMRPAHCVCLRVEAARATVDYKQPCRIVIVFTTIEVAEDLNFLNQAIQQAVIHQIRQGHF